MFLKVLAIIVLVVLGFRMLVRVFLPILGRYAIKKVSQNFEEQMKSQSQGQRVYEDGKVEIRKSESSQKQNHSADNMDEYIDFEEVK
ncbi:MAG: DUF4834 family protein [Flavobacteriales bacterium]